MQPAEVAIIGYACRFPGAATPAEFWGLISDGREASRLPHDVAEFDADFFDISPREARAMDPRQRLVLELTWECLEEACLIPKSTRGQQVSVYVGAMSDDYAILTLTDVDNHVDHHAFAGVSRAMIANKVSYTFGWNGPSMTIDSGQSSSLVAVHQACESLRTGESSVAIAGGVHLNMAPQTAVLEGEFGAMSPSGRTFAFDARADGYVRSHGGAVLLLKPLRDALTDGNRIHAVIRGSAVGNGGHPEAGQAVPSAAAQADVVRRALKAAGLNSADVHYIEAHGTGTAVGDPIELTALGEVFADCGQSPVSIGSVKTNIGHAGAASGVAGLLKTVLAIENDLVPASLNYAGPGPGIDMKSLGLRVNSTPMPWPHGTRRAGVSSFGMGGTNAHVIVEQAPAFKDVVSSGLSHMKDIPWVLSARSAAALTRQGERLLEHVRGRRPSAVDVGWSLVSTRTVFEHRAIVVGADGDALQHGLGSFAAGEPAAAVTTGRAGALGKTAFIFPGQGSQWLGMGEELHARFPAFARAFDEAADELDAHLRAPLRPVMWGRDAAPLHNTEFAQPALFAIEVALTALLRDFGVHPDFLIGHSVGEIAAAHVAGVLSLSDAAKVVAVRGRLMAGLPAGGVMIAVAASEHEVTPTLDRNVCVAAVNGAESVVISGPAGPTSAVAERFAGRGRRVHRLAVSHAFHSVLMEPITDAFRHALADISVAESRIQLISNITGEPAGAGYASPQYWADHMRRPVRFADGIRALAARGTGRFVEVGPAAGLSEAIEQWSTAGLNGSVTTLAKDRPETTSVLSGLGSLFAAGADVDWSAAFDGMRARRVDLPTYAFQRRHFWLGTADADTAADDVTAETFSRRWRAQSEGQRHRYLLDVVRTQAAIVLGHAGGPDIDAQRAFQDLGFDSMAGVELRNRLTGQTGLTFPRTLVFDHPSPAALADYLNDVLSDNQHPVSDVDRIRSLLMRIPFQELHRAGLLEPLLNLAESAKGHVRPVLSDDMIDSLSPDALIAMVLGDAHGGDTE